VPHQPAGFVMVRLGAGINLRRAAIGEPESNNADVFRREALTSGSNGESCAPRPDTRSAVSDNRLSQPSTHNSIQVISPMKHGQE
jgi:hypothetical protein